MLVPSHQLKQALDKQPHDVIALIGDEPMTKTLALDTIRQHARKQGAEERTSFTAERYFNWEQITQFSQNISLFSSRRILEINIPNGKPGVDGGKAIQAISKTAIPDTTIIINLPTLERDAKKSRWYEALSQQCLVVEIQDIGINQLPKWIAQQLSAQSQSTDEYALAFIAHQVEGNLLAAHQEIQKLGLLYPEGEISMEDVKASVLNVARFDAFQLGEAVIQGDRLRTARILQGLQDEGEQAVAVMNPLIWVIRPLLQLKLAQQQGNNLQQAMTAARVFGSRQALMKQGLARLSLKQIQAALHKLSEIDRTAKGVMAGDAWLELSRLCFGLAGIKAKSR